MLGVTVGEKELAVDVGIVPVIFDVQGLGDSGILSWVLGKQGSELSL